MSRLTTLDAYRAGLARRDLADRAEREMSAGHLDSEERARLGVAIDAELQRLSLMRHEAHAVLGLLDRSLGDGRLSTPILHAVLATLRARTAS